VLGHRGPFLCLNFSAVDVCGFDALYELYSFNVIPALGSWITGDAEPIGIWRIDPPFPRPESFAGMMRTAGVVRRIPFRANRRHLGVIGLAIVIVAICKLMPAGARRMVFARRGVFALDDPAPLQCRRVALRDARLLGGQRARSGQSPCRRPNQLGRLCEARPVHGDRPDVVGVALAERYGNSCRTRWPVFRKRRTRAFVATAF